MNKLIISICLIYVISNQIQAQGLYAKEYNSIDISIGYNASFRFLSLSDDHQDPELLNQREFDESLGFNPSIGILYNIGMTNRFTFKTGFYLANPGMRSSGLDGLYTNKSHGMKSKSEDENINSYRYNYLFVEVPMALRYIFSNQTCKAYVEFGLLTNYYIQTKVKSLDRNGDILNRVTIREDVSPFHFSGKFSFGSEWEISHAVSGFFQMNVSHQLDAINKGVVKEKLSTLGFETGIRRFI